MINWKGTEIPKSGTNMTIYLNVQLTYNEVKGILEKFFNGVEESTTYRVVNAKNSDYTYSYGISISKQTSGTLKIGYHESLLSDGSGTSYDLWNSEFNGWREGISNIILSNVDLYVPSVVSSQTGDRNNELMRLLSTTEFVQGDSYKFIEIVEDTFEADLEATY